MNVVLSVLGGAAAVEFKRHFDKDKEKQRRTKVVEQKEQELEIREQQLKAAQVLSSQKVPVLQLHKLSKSLGQSLRIECCLQKAQEAREQNFPSLSEAYGPELSAALAALHAERDQLQAEKGNLSTAASRHDGDIRQMRQQLELKERQWQAEKSQLLRQADSAGETNSNELDDVRQQLEQLRLEKQRLVQERQHAEAETHLLKGQVDMCLTPSNILHVEETRCQAS